MKCYLIESYYFKEHIVHLSYSTSSCTHTEQNWYILCSRQKEQQLGSISLTTFCCSIRAVCWKCDKSFPKAKDRKNHMATKEHGCFRVLCPFCTKQTFLRRSSPELKEHCETKHAKVIKSLANDFFSEANGFWLAIHPRDYIQLVPQPTQSEKEDDAATQAMTLIRKLFRGTKEAE